MRAIDVFQTRAGVFLSLTFYVLVCLEVGWSVYAKKKNYHWKDSAANLGIFAGLRVAEAAFLLLELQGLLFLYQKTPWRIPNKPLLLPVIFILTDFVYYWKHRLMHTFRPLWAFHVVHHSSTFFNFTTSFRLNWFQALVNFPFFIPLVLIGIDPFTLLFFYSLSAAYQFFPHTESVGRLGLLEYVFNTPSHHRVHHGKNPEYLNKNFGGVFIIWDKLFGTFAPEKKPPAYGITADLKSNNPIYLVFHGFSDLIRGRLHYRG
ncbi:MAG: sterol desaturase family protein [bacterium]